MKRERINIEKFTAPLWERQKALGESDADYQDFVTYLTSYDKSIAELFTDNGFAAAKDRCKRWQWVARRSAWVGMLNDKAVELSGQKVVDMMSRHAEDAKTFSVTARIVADSLLDRLRANPEQLKNLPLQTHIRVLADIGSVLSKVHETERIANGVNPKNELNVTHEDLSKKSTEELRKIARNG